MLQLEEHKSDRGSDAAELRSELAEAQADAKQDRCGLSAAALGSCVFCRGHERVERLCPSERLEAEVSRLKSVQSSLGEDQDKLHALQQAAIKKVRNELAASQAEARRAADETRLVQSKCRDAEAALEQARLTQQALRTQLAALQVAAAVLEG